jgi:zinc transport system permease protein
MLTDRLAEVIADFSRLFPAGTFLSYTFMVKALLAVIFVTLVCGAVGSLVVGNRMAFFSDALAHAAFASVAMALLMGLVADLPKDSLFYDLGVPSIMVGFGALVGLGIAFVREQTGLASDTVIGVFFAGAIGFGALFSNTLSQRGYYNVDSFLFGSPTAVSEAYLLVLFGLTVVTFGLLVFMYNDLIFTSFNTSLAQSRNIRVRLCNYLFIVLLALIVNICIRTVGVLLINGILIVPAATASNVCRNMRQLFWTTIALSVGVGVVGLWLSFEVNIPVGGSDLTLGSGGVIIVLSVLLFFGSMALRSVRERRSAPAAAVAKA